MPYPQHWMEQLEHTWYRWQRTASALFTLPRITWPRASKKNVAAAEHFFIFVDQPCDQRVGWPAWLFFMDSFSRVCLRLISVFGSSSCMWPPSTQKDVYEDWRLHFEACILYSKKVGVDFSGIASNSSILTYESWLLITGSQRSIHISSSPQWMLQKRRIFCMLEIFSNWNKGVGLGFRV